jgi:DNA-binding NarL/FixJ family response regulator
MRGKSEAPGGVVCPYKSDFSQYANRYVSMSPEMVSTLTLSERKVLRLLAKGWEINQIASY